VRSTIDPVRVIQEAIAARSLADQGEDHAVRLAALECVHRLDVVGRHDALER